MAGKHLQSCSSVHGEVELLGDKSISHRALMFSAISNDVCRVTGLSPARDVKSTMECLKQLGVSIDQEKNATLVQGVGQFGLIPPSEPLDCGNSGTTLRLLTGILAAQEFTSTLTGDASLNKRPMRRIIEPLELMGAEIDSADYKAPLVIKGRPLRAIDYASPIASAQVKSAILLAGLFAKGVTRVTEPYQSRDHSERLLEYMGASVQTTQAMAGIKGPFELQAREINIPKDVSAAAFFLVAGALLENSELILKNVGINTTRTGIFDVLSSMEAQYEIADEALVNNEPRAQITIKSSSLQSTTLSGPIIPRVIDEIPIIAVAATQAHGTTIIKDARELRVKESDRIAAIVNNLKRMKADVREKQDGFVIKGPTPLKGANINSYGDHRIAMAFSIAALIAEGETVIDDIECINISFPGFYESLEDIIEN